MTNTDQTLKPVADVVAGDVITTASSMLTGVSDALAFRAAAEGDDMLAMLASVIDSQVSNLSALVKR